MTAVGSATALAAFGLLNAAPAAAQDLHYAQARIADIGGLCATADSSGAPVGDVHTDRDGDAASADWSNHDGVVTPDNFPQDPSVAESSVTRSDDELTAASTVEGFVLDSACFPVSHPDFPTMAVDSISSTSTWSVNGGASTEISLQGLEVLGTSIDLAPGESDSFTETIEIDGHELEVSVEANLHSGALGGDEENPPTTANSWLLVNLDTVITDPDGEETEVFQSVELGHSSVHSDFDAELGDDDDDDDDDDDGDDDDDNGDDDGDDDDNGDDDGDDGKGDDDDDADDGKGDKGDDADEGGLPVTGGALAGLIAAAVAAVGGGGLALHLSRRKKNAAEESGEDTAAE
jgi:hypothetical protein